MNQVAALPHGLLETASEYIRRRTGLVFGPSRRQAFEAALTTVLHPGLHTRAWVLDRLDHEPGLMDDLVAAITIGESYFFREAGQGALIRDQIVPDLLSGNRRGQPLRVWSAGCAAGEEPYSLAILLRQAGAVDPHILGTDLSRAALARAARGRYTKWSLRGVSHELIGAHFRRVGEQFVLAPAVRSAVEFRYLNLAEDVYPSMASGVWGMDLILCRNVLIYFDQETITRVATHLLDSLSSGGWLLLGSSDPGLSHLVPCDVQVTSAGLAYRRTGRGVRQLTLQSALEPVLEPEPSVAEVEPPPAELEPESPGSELTLESQVVTADEGDLEQCIVLVRGLANQGQLDPAGQACAAALDRYPASAELTYLHAVLLFEAGHHSAAVSAARRALYLDRHLVVAHVALATALVRLGETRAAERSLRNAESLLSSSTYERAVPAADGEPAGRMLEMVRTQLQILAGAA